LIHPLDGIDYQGAWGGIQARIGNRRINGNNQADGFLLEYRMIPFVIMCYVLKCLPGQ